MDLPLVGGAYTDFSLNLNAQTCINFYPHRDDHAAKNPFALYPTPGLTLWREQAGNSVRGLYEINNLLYAVIDNKFYIIDRNANASYKGNIKTGYGPVTIVSNGNNQTVVYDGLSGFVYDSTDDSFEEVTDLNFIAPVIGAYQDGFGIYIQPNSNLWWLTDINDFKAIDPLDFYSLSGTADNLVSIASTHQELWLMNRSSAEIWYNTGAVDTFFERRQGLLIDFGCEAPYSVTKSSNGTLNWLARNNKGRAQFVRVEGFVPKVISTPPIEMVINSYEKISDVIGYTYKSNGHEFSVWTFPSADATWVYDHTENEWHQRTSVIDNDFPRVLEQRRGRHRGNCYAFAFGKHLVGDAFTGNIYILDEDNVSDNGTYIARERACPHLSIDVNLLTVTNLEIVMETGVGLVSGQGSDPQIMLDISKNNGHTYGTERWKSMGLLGDYAHRVRWKRLGRARDWVPRIRITDPVKCVLISMRADINAGNAQQFSQERLRAQNGVTNK